MTIEKLTDTEVQIVATTSAGAKLLRLSNALTAENERLRAEVEGDNGLRASAAAGWAAATALLKEAARHVPGLVFERNVDALLANQQAAPNTPRSDLDGHSPREMCLAGQPAAPDEIGDYPRNFADRVSKMMTFTPAAPTHTMYEVLNPQGIVERQTSDIEIAARQAQRLGHEYTWRVKSTPEQREEWRKAAAPARTEVELMTKGLVSGLVEERNALEARTEAEQAVKGKPDV